MGDKLGPNGWALHVQSFVRALVMEDFYGLTGPFGQDRPRGFFVFVGNLRLCERRLFPAS
jgi:hypothetical protein